MNWFYATENQTQAGPVDEATLQGLLSSGSISTETLIWRQGMDNWTPYSTIFSPPALTGTAGEPGLTRCSECGLAFPPAQLISLAGRPVCGACKPVAVQKFQEGMLSFGTPVDAEELWRRVEQRGFDFTISSVLSRSWDLVKGNFWPSIGITLLCYLIMTAPGQIPLIGVLALCLVQPQIMAGLNWYFLKQFRGESATLNDSFAGFRRGYGQQALYMLIIFGISVGAMLVCIVPLIFIFTAAKSHNSISTTVSLVFIAMIPFILVLWYFMITWIFTPLLILDKGLKATAAMKLSRRVVRLRFWKIVGLFFVVGLLCMVSLLALLVGIVVMLPVAFATLSRLYEDAFGDEGAR